MNLLVSRWSFPTLKCPDVSASNQLAILVFLWTYNRKLAATCNCKRCKLLEAYNNIVAIMFSWKLANCQLVLLRQAYPAWQSDYTKFLFPVWFANAMKYGLFTTSRVFRTIGFAQVHMRAPQIWCPNPLISVRITIRGWVGIPSVRFIEKKIYIIPGIDWDARCISVDLAKYLYVHGPSLWLVEFDDNSRQHFTIQPAIQPVDQLTNHPSFNIIHQPVSPVISPAVCPTN